MRRAALLLAVALSPGTVAAPASGAPAEACGARDVVVTVDTLHVTVGPVTTTVRAGQTARFEVAVGRPSEGAAGEGAPLDPVPRAPAPDVLAAVWVGVEPFAVASVEKTAGDGTTEVRVEIPRTARPGTYDLRGFAWNVIVSGCVTLEEIGRADLPGSVTVVKPKPRPRAPA